MHTTLDSLTSTDYSDKHKLLMVIAGGDITGSDNDKTTPEICEDLIEPFNLSSFESPTPQSYLAIGEGKKQHKLSDIIVMDIMFQFVLLIKMAHQKNEKGLKPVIVVNEIHSLY